MLTITLPPNPQYHEDLPHYASGYISKHWWPELRLDLDLSQVAADFYLFYAMKDASPYLQEKFEEYAQVVAKQIAIYVDAAVGGELRHIRFKGLKKIGHNDDRSIARRDWREKRIAQGISLLEEGRDAFYQRQWKSAFGGPKWGAIADALLNHLHGQYSPTLFVDQTLALQHNTGSVFNKVVGYWHQKNLMQVLNANLDENWEALVAMGSPWACTLFTQWYREEDELEVEGIEYSRPRELSTLQVDENGPDIKMGDVVKINNRARTVSIRGKEGLIVAPLIPIGTPPYYDAMVEIEGRRRRMRISSLIVVAAATVQTSLEYIEGEK